MRRLTRSRPPFSNAFGHPHRRLARPEDSDDGQPTGTNASDGQPQPSYEFDDSGDEFSPTDTDTDADGEPPDTDDENEPEPEFTLDHPPRATSRLPGLTYQDERLIVREFDSFYDFVTCAADDSLRQWGNFESCQSSRGPDARKPWYASASMEHATDMALNRGWPQGRELLSSIMAQVRAQPVYYKNQSFDVGGAYPSVPTYCMGDPACMIETHNDHLTSRPVVCIDYKCNASANITAQSIMFYGAAMLSLVLELEAFGYSVELRITSDTSAYIGPSLRITFVYKRAGENLDLDRAAFAIAHPSVLRRFTFAIKEQHHDLHAGYHVGYGHPATIVYNENDLTIKIPALDDNITSEQAKILVQTAASQFLKPTDLAA